MAVDSDSYGTVAGVESVVGDIPINTTNARNFSATTVPSLAEVEAFVDDVASELNDALSFVGYTVPVVVGADKHAHGFLARANNAGAAVMVLDSLPAEAYAVPGDEIPAQGRKQHLQAIFLRALKRINEEKLSATKDSGGTRLGDLRIGSEKDSEGRTNKPLFTRSLTDAPSTRSLVEP